MGTGSSNDREELRDKHDLSSTPRNPSSWRIFEINFRNENTGKIITRMKINSKQLPIKAHFLFLMAAMGPILPFLTVYGKQLGVSPMVIGTVTAILPILFLIAKPAFGFLVDYFRDWRKSIFVGLLIVTSLAFVSMYFLPSIPDSSIAGRTVNVTISGDETVSCESRNISEPDECYGEKSVVDCRWKCDGGKEFSSTTIFRDRRESNFSVDFVCIADTINDTIGGDNNRVERTCELWCEKSKTEDRCLYKSVTFWGFVVLISLGCIGFNVSNSISDAICFDVLGERGQMGYGRQRVWGTIGFGVTAFLAGFAVDYWSQGKTIKSYTPAFILICVFTFFDVLCCAKLELPIISGSKSIAKDVYGILKLRPVLIFLCFATMAGIFDGFIVYFLFWYLEDLAMVTGHMGHITLIEGLIVAAETLGGEVIFFSLSGKILKKFGYGYSFVFCFVCYALRLGLVSLAPNPWWVIPIEFMMQGPSYALCYTTIVAYASVVSPPGTSATVQGIVAGMDDGVGFAVGSLAGGVLYKNLGGAITLQIYAFVAALSAMMYLLLHMTYLRHVMPETKRSSDPSRSTNVEWKSPEEAAEECLNDDDTGCNADTVASMKMNVR